MSKKSKECPSWKKNLILVMSYRCETQDEPCRDLDEIIALALGWQKRGSLWYSPEEIKLAAKKKKSIHIVTDGLWSPPRFTGSLDDAAELSIQFGFIAALGDIVADGLPGCVLCTSTDPVIQYAGVSLAGKDPVGRLARAVTSACLTAMAAELDAAGE